MQQLPKHEVRPLLEPFLALADDHDFWNHSLDGLAVLGARGMFRVYKLQRPVAPLAVVANCFPIKPLLGILQSAECYQVLGLNRQGSSSLRVTVMFWTRSNLTRVSLKR